MLKAIVSFSKKVPAETEYSSKGYSLSLETEIPETDPAGIRARLSETFELVKSQVELELSGRNGSGAPPPADGPTRPAAGNNGNGARATNKQVKFILDLAKGQGMGLSQINERVNQEFGVDTVYELDRKSASKLVDTLKAA
jgi:hypothetical protein